MESKIISFSERRKLRDLKIKEKQFKTYLSSLKKDQLQIEANYIINKVNEHDLTDEFLLKSALLMDELANRVTINNMSHTISKFSKNLRSKMSADVPTLQ